MVPRCFKSFVTSVRVDPHRFAGPRGNLKQVASVPLRGKEIGLPQLWVSGFPSSCSRSEIH